MLRSILLKLSESKKLARWTMKNGLSRRVAQRFVAGESLEQAIAAAKTLNADGFSASLDLLGENVMDMDGAKRAADVYISMFDRIATEKLNANISMKLTQLGLDLDPALCESLLERIVRAAGEHGNFLRIDMEGSPYTQRTIGLCKRVRARTNAVGTVIQSYLFRSEEDVRGLIAVGCRIRLVKAPTKSRPKLPSRPSPMSTLTL